MHWAEPCDSTVSLFWILWVGRSESVRKQTLTVTRTHPRGSPTGSLVASTKPMKLLCPKALLVRGGQLPVPSELHPWAFLPLLPRLGYTCVLSHKTVNWGLWLTSCQSQQGEALLVCLLAPGAWLLNWFCSLPVLWLESPHTPYRINTQSARLSVGSKHLQTSSVSWNQRNVCTLVSPWVEINGSS